MDRIITLLYRPSYLSFKTCSPLLKNIGALTEPMPHYHRQYKAGTYHENSFSNELKRFSFEFHSFYRPELQLIYGE